MKITLNFKLASLAFILGIYSFFNPSFAQFDSTYLVSKVQRVDSVGWVFFYPDSMLTTQSVEFVNNAILNNEDADLFHNETSFEELWSRTDSLLEQKHTFYQQYHYTYPVLGAGFTEHAYETDYVHSLSGRVAINMPDLPDIGIVPETDALDSITNRSVFLNHTLVWLDSLWQLGYQMETNDSTASLKPEGRLVWYQSTIDTLEKAWSLDGDNYQLCWEFPINSTPIPDSMEAYVHHFYYIDAQNGTFVDSINRKMGVGTAICRFPYNSTQTIDIQWRGGLNNDYYLRADNSARNFETRVGNGKAWFWTAKTTNKTKNWGTDDQYHTTAHFHVQNSWEYFRNAHRWHGPDNASMEVRIHVSNDPNNGSANSIQYENKCDCYYLIVGNNSGTTQFDGTLDEIGHEYSHSFISETVDLPYTGIQGAIQEGLADAFGVSIEHWVDGGSPDWAIGNDEVFKRNVAFPGLSDLAEHYSQVQNTQGVYYNGAVIGRWFYILSQGEEGVGDPYNVSGIGINEARNIVYYLLAAGYINSSADFPHLAAASVRAASDIHGDCSWEVRQTILAWNRVGLFPTSNCTTTSVNEEYFISSVKVYPNPTSENLNVTLANNIQQFDYFVMDITGREVIGKTLVKGSKTTINISSLTSGTYLIQVGDSQGRMTTKKFIVNK